MRRLIFLFSLLTISFCSYSQSINLGVVGGANISPLGVSNVPGYVKSNLVPGYDAGLFADFWFEQLSIEPVVQYTAINDNVITDDPAFGGGFATAKYRIHYLQIPVNVYYNIPFSLGKVFIGGGPYWGLGLSGTVNINSTSYVDNGVYYTNYTYNYKFASPDYGINLTVGVRLKNKLKFSAGYTHGYTNDGNNPYYNGIIKVNSFNLLAGFSFL